MSLYKAALIGRAAMSSNNSSLNSSLGGGNTTNDKNGPFTITSTWTIENFSTLEAKGDDVFKCSIKTETGTAAACTWQLVLKPNGKNPAKDTFSLYLHLSPISICQEVYANFSACIVNKEGKKMSSKSIQARRFIAKAPRKIACGWGWKDFWIKDKYFRTNVLSDNKLTISFEVVFSSYRDCLVKNCTKTSLSYSSNVQDCNLSEDLESLWKSEAFSDVILATKGKDFPCHKLILSARSQVFNTIFQNKAKKLKANRLEIDDLSPEVVEEMLRFIYTGKCEKLEELTEGLLTAAVKYDLNRLKIICGRALYKTLSVENAASILILSDSNNLREMKNDVIDYIVSKATEVFSTKGWKILLSKDRLFEEVLQSMACQLASNQAENITE